MDWAAHPEYGQSAEGRRTEARGRDGMGWRHDARAAALRDDRLGRRLWLALESAGVSVGPSCQSLARGAGRLGRGDMGAPGACQAGQHQDKEDARAGPRPATGCAPSGAVRCACTAWQHVRAAPALSCTAACSGAAARQLVAGHGALPSTRLGAWALAGCGTGPRQTGSLAPIGPRRAAWRGWDERGQRGAHQAKTDSLAPPMREPLTFFRASMPTRALRSAEMRRRLSAPQRPMGSVKV